MRDVSRPWASVGTKRRPVDLSRAPQARIDESGFPVEISPAIPGTDLAGWAAASRDRIQGLLARHGALAFRGFELEGAPDLQRFAEAGGTELYGDYGDLPREKAGGKVYGTTPYPADRAILFHNESSHQYRFPRRLLFLCETAPESGGATPLADGRRALAALDRRLAGLLEARGLRYVRTFTPGIDVAWQDFFRTGDRAQVEARCRAEAIACSWRGDRLRIEQRAPAVVRHPVTGERALFNQVLLHHRSRLDSEVREALLSLLPAEDLPRDVTWGDGTPIEDAVVDDVAGALESVAVDPPWRPGDAVMLDNILVAHGRRPYTGTRKVVVAMGDMTTVAELEAQGGPA